MVKKGYHIFTDTKQLIHRVGLLENLTWIFLMDVTSELTNELNFPKLMFCYLKTKAELYLPPDFFRGMPELEVVHIEGLNLKSLPKSFLTLKKLRALYLKRCGFIDISSIGDMKNLEILVLVSSKSKKTELPQSIGNLSQVKLLDLRESSFAIPPGIISRLTELEELYIEGRYDQPGDATILKVEELTDLRLLSALPVRVPDAAVEALSKTTVFQNLQRYNIVIGDQKKKRWYIPESSRSLQVVSNTNISWEEVIQQLKGIENLFMRGVHVRSISGSSLSLRNLRFLRIEDGRKMICLVSVSMAKCLTALEEINIRRCKKIVQIIENEGDMEGIITMPRLKMIELMGLKNLTCFYSGNHTFHFPLLEIFRVLECPNFISFSSGAFSMPNLQWVMEDDRIRECKDHQLNGLIREKKVCRLPFSYSFFTSPVGL